jgi:hypothetical protein
VTDKWRGEVRSVILRLRRYRDRMQGVVAAAAGQPASGGSAAILRRARAEGIRCSGEASPHHLLLTDEACDGYDTQAKMNPPLRTKRDIAELKAAIADGTIDVLATDHAPHTVAEKARDFASAPFGIIGLDCALPLYAKALVEDGVIGWPRMIELMTRTPAELCGLDALGLGTLREGSRGDVTVIDPNLEWTIDANAFASKSRNCPFHGWKFNCAGAAVAKQAHRSHAASSAHDGCRRRCHGSSRACTSARSARCGSVAAPMAPSTAIFCKVGDTATVLMMSPATSNSRPSKMARPKFWR